MSAPHPILGVWEVTADGAPFAHHVMVFHPDGTALQSNPDRGNPDTSDSNGIGTWRAEGEMVTGAFLEFVVDRSDRDLVNKGIISFELEVTDDRFSGSATVRFYDLTGELRRGPSTSRLTGIRFTA
ncbi:hypothetical protein [Nocardia sp. NPDC051570]|uniref:hypothetical protein n=1 Tax=Nocardia sp. NPDC051570 TaxID=3364324 RepID=UPI0037A23395